METMSAMAGLFLFGSRVIACKHCPYKWFHRVSGQHWSNRQGWFHHLRILQKTRCSQRKAQRVGRVRKSTSFYRLFRNFLERRVFFFLAPPASIRNSNTFTPCSATLGGILTRFRVRFFWERISLQKNYKKRICNLNVLYFFISQS